MHKFELAGSKAHYLSLTPFKIRHIKLELDLDLENEYIRCKEYIIIENIRERSSIITLDAAELNIKSLKGNGVLGFNIIDDKLNIYIEPVSNNRELTLEINYEAKPRRGLYFIKGNEIKDTQVWTQGEATDSKYWFVCIDHPNMRFSSEIIVTIPKELIAISNGKLVEIIERDNKKIYHWLEENSHPAYLTSLVVGSFTKIDDNYNNIQLSYYIPKDKAVDEAMLSFNNTKDMIEFFEEYTGIRYPYNKYSQVVVKDFIYGGMENINATTLTIDTLHDGKAHIDFTSDHLVSHELAHQWFGDLVTCRDWQHLWLNEAFATYFDALYWKKSRGKDEFDYYMLQLAEEYYEEYRKRYKRAIVTNVYKTPDELFDRHTYEKGACVLHMLRMLIGDNNFRKIINLYLSRYKFESAETDDLRRCIEEFGFSIEQFFYQWLRKDGHPQLKVEVSTLLHIVNVKITQIQEEPYSFPLDIRIALKSGKILDYTIDISEKEHTIAIPIKREERMETQFVVYPSPQIESVVYISIDPDNKLLKQLELKIPKEMLIELLYKGNNIEKIYAANSLAEYSSEDVINALRTIMLSNNTFWGVSVECAKALSKIKTDEAYKVLIESLKIEHPKVRRSVVRAIGEFRNEKCIEILLPFLLNDKSYFVQGEAALSIGKCRSKEGLKYLINALEMRSFNEVIASNAIQGIAEIKDRLDIIISKCAYNEHHAIREAATLALEKYLNDENAYIKLIELLKDRWFKVRINAIKALRNAKIEKAIPELERVAKMDLEPRVRRVAEEAILEIREYIKKPEEIGKIEEEIDRLKIINKELVYRIDRLESRH